MKKLFNKKAFAPAAVPGAGTDRPAHRDRVRRYRTCRRHRRPDRGSGRQRRERQGYRFRCCHRCGRRRGAIGMGMAIAKSAEGIARQPEAEGKIRTTMMLGLVFLETAIIYALLVVILIIFVL